MEWDLLREINGWHWVWEDKEYNKSEHLVIPKGSVQDYGDILKGFQSQMVGAPNDNKEL
jgi:hypothetical protein